MGLFSGISAMDTVQRLKAGGTGRLSYAQVADLIINLPDAKRNLTPIQFQVIFDHYCDLKRSTTKYEVDYQGYLAMCVDIIESLDPLAPYELYSGTSIFETKKLLEQIRASRDY